MYEKKERILESKTNYTIVGIAVVVLLLGFIITALWLSEGFDHKSYRDYVVYMEEPVSGLSEGSLVKYNGVKVGMVERISLGENPQWVKLLLKIEDDVPVTVSTVANLIPQGITGVAILGLSVTSPDLTPLKAKPGEPYPIIPYRPSFLSQIETTIDDLNKNLKEFISPENAQNFKRILDNFQQVSKVMAVNDKALNKTLQELPKLTSELRVASKQFGDTMTVGEDLLNNILQSSMPSMVTLIHQLQNMTNNVTQLSDDLKQNPSMLVWGKPPIKKGPGE